MVPSFANDLVLFSTDTGFLIFCTTDLTRIVHRFQANEREPAKHVAWFIYTISIYILNWFHFFFFNKGR